MKTLYSTVLIAVLALGILLAVSPNKAEAWYRGPAVGFSLVVPPFGFSIGAPAPYYYAPPPYPVYESAYYWPYYGPYYGYYGHRHWAHRGWHGGGGHERGRGRY